MSIALQTEKGIIALSEKTKITFEQNSPFIDRENLRMNFTTNFKLPGTTEVCKILDNEHLLEVSESNKKINVGLLSDGVNVANGLLLLNESRVNRNTRKVEFNTQFLGELSKYADAIENKSIKDLQLFDDITIAGEDITTIDSATANNIRSKRTTDWASDIVNNGHDYLCFPTCKVADEFYTWANLWNDATNELIVPTAPPMGSGAGNRIVLASTIIPMIYYHQVLRHCFSEFGYVLQGDFINNSYFKKHVIINNFSPTKQRVNTLLNLSTGNPENAQYTELDTTVKASNHLPDVSIKDFLNDFMIKFGAAFKIKGNVVEVILLSEKKSFNTNIQSPNYIKAKSEGKLVRLYYEYTDEEKEIYPTEIIPDFNQGNNLELTPAFRACWHGEQEPFNSSNKIWAPIIRTGIEKYPVENCIASSTFPPSLPITATFASFEYQNENAYECPKEIGIYHGLLNTVSAKVSPYMSHDNLQHNTSNDVIGEWSLVWQNSTDRYGLVDVFLQAWLKVMNSDDKRIFYINENYGSFINKDHEFFQIIGNQEYYVAKKRCQLPLRKEVEYECYKI